MFVHCKWVKFVRILLREEIYVYAVHEDSVLIGRQPVTQLYFIYLREFKVCNCDGRIDISIYKFKALQKVSPCLYFQIFTKHYQAFN